MDISNRKVLQYFLIFLYTLIHINDHQSVNARKNCRLKKHPSDLTYFLKCDGYFDDRTTVRRENKEKKNRKGLPGPPGPQGPSGIDGKDGQEGPQGPMGPTGPTGVPGRRGPLGPTGEPGDKGDAGPLGPQGEAGLPGNCIKDSPLNKEIAGKLYHCLPGPIGPQGHKGDSGTPGQQGPAGKNGLKGEKGDSGPRGRRGPVGMPGLPGSTGNVACSTHFTEWIGRFSHMDDKSFEGVFCQTGHFLQGFKIEKEGLKERYNYVCCKLG